MRAPIEQVCDGVATARNPDGWFTSGAMVDAKPSGEIRFRWHEWGADKVTTADGGTILEADRPHRFAFP